MTDEEKQQIWDYIILLALKCASESNDNPFNVVEEKKKQLETPEILK
jgi:hypothetical protein